MAVARTPCLFGCFLVCASSAAASTTVGGVITVDTTWTSAGSPYIMMTPVTIGGGATLTIEPGVEVRANNANVGLTVGSAAPGGSLRAIGTVSAPIRFTANPPASSAWKGIVFSTFTTDATFDESGAYAGGSTLQHCTADSGSSLTSLLTIDGAAPFLANCWFTNSHRPLLVKAAPSGVLRIESTSFTDCGNLLGDGGAARLDMSVAGCTIAFTQCSFISNQSGFGSGAGGAIYVSGSNEAALHIVSCDFYDNVAHTPGSACGSSAALGGALFVTKSGSGNFEVVVTDSLFAGNDADGCVARGGALYMRNESSLGSLSVHVTGTTFCTNRAIAATELAGGGGIFVTETTSGTTTLSLAGDPSGRTSNRFMGNVAINFGANPVAGADLYNDLVNEALGMNSIVATHACWSGQSPSQDDNPLRIFDSADDPTKAWVLFSPELTGVNCMALEGDLDGTGNVGPSDLAILLGAWGSDSADLDGDGVTGPSDLAILLGQWSMAECQDGG